MSEIKSKEGNERAVKEQYQVTITKTFTALENLEDCGDNNRARDNVTESIKTSAKGNLGYFESKYHKSCFDKNFKIG
jgi:hypothetical protein